MRFSLALLLLLAACAPQAQPLEPVNDSAAIAIKSDALDTADGTELPARSWLPKGRPKAVIIAVHGFNDYSRAFTGVGEFFESHGIAVYAYDQRGFGRAPDTGIWASKENLTRDLSECVQQAKQRWPHTPVYILGESMGGAVVITALANPAFPHVQGVILSAPAVWGNGTMNPLYRAVLWTAAHTIPFKTLSGAELKIMASDNIPMLRELGRDPLIIKHTRVDAIYGLVGLMDDAYAKVPAVKTPTLMLYGAHDQVIPSKPIKDTRARFPAPLTYAYYPDGYHMLMRDLERDVVLKDILSWITHPNRPLPSGFGEKDKK